ncbi:MAG: tetratricopeptide repeat protein [Bacteroidales bacterium]|nr:tetratricopeptide repeat protein [Bacteroidales bacterium]
MKQSTFHRMLRSILLLTLISCSGLTMGQIKPIITLPERTYGAYIDTLPSREAAMKYIPLAFRTHPVYVYLPDEQNPKQWKYFYCKKIIVTEDNISFQARKQNITWSFKDLFSDFNFEKVLLLHVELTPHANMGQGWRYAFLYFGKDKPLIVFRLTGYYEIPALLKQSKNNYAFKLASAFNNFAVEQERLNSKVLFEAFKVEAEKYSALKEKPVMSEEQRKYVVQANALVKLKKYADAIQFYKKVIELNATSYPEAYNNLALLYAQLNRYSVAIFYMREYLLLEPSPKDARAAQDKIYEWELYTKPQK